jgi:broad specificity phosphatase PhoE
MVRKGLVTAITLMLLCACWPLAAYAQRLVFVVRHAERADDGASKMQMQTDPALSPAGAARALRLATMLADAGITAIYATEFRRTQDTARPLATRLGLKIRSVPSKDIDGLLSKLGSEHVADVVLVVGHSNTVPAIVKALSGSAITLTDKEYDNLFLVVPETRQMTRIHFTP